MEFGKGLIEGSLSVNNVFILTLLFANFRVKSGHQRKVLFWGVFGTLLMRAAMILAGAELFAAFVWLGYLFGILLVAAGI